MIPVQVMTSARGLSKLGSGAGGRILVVVSQPVCVFGNENKLTETDNKFQILNLLVKGNKFIGIQVKTPKDAISIALYGNVKYLILQQHYLGLFICLKTALLSLFLRGRCLWGRVHICQEENHWAP